MMRVYTALARRWTARILSAWKPSTPEFRNRHDGGRLSNRIEDLQHAPRLTSLRIRRRAELPGATRSLGYAIAGEIRERLAIAGSMTASLRDGLPRAGVFPAMNFDLSIPCPGGSRAVPASPRAPIPHLAGRGRIV